MRALVTMALLAGVARPAWADVDYAIDLTKPDHHSGRVSMTLPASDGASIDIKMPAWRTGRYTILNLANGVSGFAATDAAGKPLRWEKVDKSTWRIHRPAGTAVRVAYDIYGNELGLRSRHIDDSHAYLNPSAIFMYADRHRSEPVKVALKLPAGWKAFSGMDPAGQGFTAANWDVFTDSPIEAGPHQLRSFEADGKRYEMVIWGRGNYDADKMVADLRKMVPQAQSIWKGYPFQRYLFIVHATDGAGGATEHKNSTVIQRPRYRFKGEGHMGFLGTASHEFVHTWNVKAYRDAAMVPYDYQNENYSKLLWVHEGSTEYFTDHLLLRAGLTKPSDYFGTLADSIDANKNRPGRLVQSVADASFDEWISPTTDRNRSNNAWVNIYSEGAIASWALDIALLQDTGGKVSYRDVHQKLWERYGNGAKGFTPADMKGILAELTGHSWDAWWAKHVDAPSDVDFAALLAPVGLKLDMGGAPTVAQAGWQASASGGAMKLSGVAANGPAWNAGLEVDDILVAIDGRRLDESRFGSILTEYKPGDTVTVSFFRRDELQTRKMVLGGRPAGNVSVTPVANASAAQKALFQRWLLVPYPTK